MNLEPQTLNREAIPRLDILLQCRHYAQFRCCDNCPNNYGGMLDDCPIITDWKEAVATLKADHREASHAP